MDTWSTGNSQGRWRRASRRSSPPATRLRSRRWCARRTRPSSSSPPTPGSSRSPARCRWQRPSTARRGSTRTCARCVACSTPPPPRRRSGWARWAASSAAPRAACSRSRPARSRASSPAACSASTSSRCSTAEAPARLLFVAPNLGHAAGTLDAEADQLLHWVALHEITHALQFGGVPWLRGHLAGIVLELLEALDMDPTKLFSGAPGLDDLRGLRGHRPRGRARGSRARHRAARADGRRAGVHGRARGLRRARDGCRRGRA